MKLSLRILLLVIFLAILPIVIVLLVSKHRKLLVTENSITTLYEPRETTLNFPLRISISDLEQLANKKIGATLIDRKIPIEGKNDTLVLKVTRIGNLDFVMNNQQFDSELPLRIEAQYIKGILKNKGIKFFKKEPLELIITPKFQSSIDLKNDLTIKSRTVLQSIRWEKEPIVKIAGFTINLKEKISELIFEQANKITGNIDQLISTKINLKKPTSKVWFKIQHAIRANKKQKDVYVKTQPKSLSVFVDKSQDDSLQLDLTVVSRIYVRFARDTAQIKTIPFPKRIRIIRKRKTEQQESKLYLHFLIPLENLNQIVRKELIGKKISVLDLNCRIKDFKIFNGRKHIFVRIKYTGNIQGEVLVKGIPKLSPDNKTIVIQNLEFENKSKDEVYTSFTDVLYEQILALVENYVRFDVGETLESLPVLAQKAIDKSKMAKKTSIQLHQLELEKLRFFLTRDNIQLIVSGHSSFEVALKKETFKGKKKRKK